MKHRIRSRYRGIRNNAMQKRSALPKSNTPQGPSYLCNVSASMVVGANPNNDLFRGGENVSEETQKEQRAHGPSKTMKQKKRKKKKGCFG